MLRPLIAVSAIIHYLAKMLLPVKQALLYPRWPDTFFNPRYWISLAIFIAAIELIRRNRRRLGDHWLWALCLFILTVSPVLGLKHFGWSQFSFVSDHYMYYGSAGVILMIGILLAKWTGIPVLSADSADTGKPGIDKKRLFIVTACTLIALIACGVRTVQLNRTWKNNVTFSENILKINPDSSVANSNLGHYYFRKKDYERALLYYREWARIYPEYYKSWRACARTAAELHRVEETIGYYKQAIMAVDSRIPRGWWKIRTEYAEYLTYIGWISEAINEYQGIIEKQPPNRKYLEKTVKGLRKRLRKSPSGK